MYYLKAKKYIKYKIYGLTSFMLFVVYLYLMVEIGVNGQNDPSNYY